MKIISVVHGTQEWHEHRAGARNASDAPAVMGASPYVSRSAFVHMRATGAAADVGEYQQRIFDAGHAVEPALIEYCERVIGDDLFAQIGVSDDGYLSASLDGLTFDSLTIAEVKQANSSKMDDVRAGGLPDSDYWQVVQQFAVCDSAQRCIYAVGDGTDDGTVHLIVQRADIECNVQRLRAAWGQLDADVAGYQHAPATSAPVAAPVAGFGALSLRVEGRVRESNLDVFRADADAFIARLPKPADLQTDQDFADAEGAVKACAEAEARIKAAKDAALAQMSDVDAVLRAADIIGESIRVARLALDRAVKAEKENRRTDLIRTGVDAVRAHYAGINATMRGYEMACPASLTAEVSAVIKGLKSLESMRAKIGAAVADAKVSASMEADRRRVCIALLPADRTLFPDAAGLVAGKTADDLRNLIIARIAEHDAKILRDAEAKAEQERCRVARIAEHDAVPARIEPAYIPAPAIKLSSANAMLKLGDINARISPLTITADGLASLGYSPAGQERAAKLYRESDMPAIYAAMLGVIRAAAQAGGLA